MAREELLVELNEGFASLLGKEDEPAIREWHNSHVI